MKTRRQPNFRRSSALGFTLVELLVVIGIIAILIAILMPSLNKARAYAKKVQCMSNLKQIGNELLMYSNNNKGWLVPVGGWEEDGRPGRYMSLGTNVAPNLRWPMRVFKMPTAPDPPPWGSTPYVSQPYDPVTFPAEPYTPKVMICPADDPEVYEAHSYIINKHLAKEPEEVKKYGSKMNNGRSVSEVPLMGEKRSTTRDYYMEKENYENAAGMTEFANVVELYRHGITYGSNYLFMDMHVASQLPAEAAAAMDPWDVPKADAPPPTP